MEVKIGLAKTSKYATGVCGDSCDIVERPHGGISAVIADGQGNGLAAHHTSSWVVHKAVELISDGARDGAVARAVHDYLYAMKDKKVSCTLTVLSADLDTETLVVSRNSNCPVIVKTEEYETVYDEDVSPIGVNRPDTMDGRSLHVMTRTIQNKVLEKFHVFLTVGFYAIATDRQADFEKIMDIIHDNPPEDAAYIAKAIMDYALELDDEKATDDMTVVVLGVTSGSPAEPKIEQIEVTYPY